VAVAQHSVGGTLVRTGRVECLRDVGEERRLVGRRGGVLRELGSFLDRRQVLVLRLAQLVVDVSGDRVCQFLLNELRHLLQPRLDRLPGLLERLLHLVAQLLDIGVDVLADLLQIVDQSHVVSPSSGSG
jgi:hypothetical protein